MEDLGVVKKPRRRIRFSEIEIEKLVFLLELFMYQVDMIVPSIHVFLLVWQSHSQSPSGVKTIFYND